VETSGVRRGWGWKKSLGSPNPDAEERLHGSREPNAGVWSQIPRPDFVGHRGPEEVPEEPSRSPETSTAP
jgi:hypothetical protein